MDAYKMAQEAMTVSEELLQEEKVRVDDSNVTAWVARAQAYAAIAQVEQLTRIADALYTKDRMEYCLADLLYTLSSR